MAIENSIVEDPRLMYSIGRNRYSTLRKFGFNEAVAASKEDLWSAGGTYGGFLTAAGVASVTSASGDDDTDGGSGARKLQIFGLDADWNLYDEEIELEGVSAATTTGTFIRVFRAKVTEVGTYGGSNTGVLTVAIGGTTVAVVPASGGQTQMAIYSVPNGYTAYLQHLRVTSESSRPMTFEVMVRENADVTSAPGMGASRVIFTLFGITAPIEIDPHALDRFPAKSDLWISATGTSNAAKVTGEFDLVLVRDSN